MRASVASFQAATTRAASVQKRILIPRASLPHRALLDSIRGFVISDRRRDVSYACGEGDTERASPAPWRTMELLPRMAVGTVGIKWVWDPRGDGLPGWLGVACRQETPVPCLVQRLTHLARLRSESSNAHILLYNRVRQHTPSSSEGDYLQRRVDRECTRVSAGDLKHHSDALRAMEVLTVILLIHFASMPADGDAAARVSTVRRSTRLVFSNSDCSVRYYATFSL